MKQGFTLMEILAVLLIIAVISAFALPVVKSARDEVRHHQAKNAALKMAEAIRTFYQNTRGYLVKGTVIPSQIQPKDTCEDLALWGAPVNDVDRHKDVGMLFDCRYLSSKDFGNLPYTFVPERNPHVTNKLVTVTGSGKAAGKYQDKSFTVYRDMSIEEKEE